MAQIYEKDEDVEILLKIRALLNHRDKMKFFILIVLIILGAIIETIGISLMFPFVNLIINPEYLNNNPIIDQVLKNFNFRSDQSFIIVVGFGILLFYLFKNVYLVLMYYSQYRVVYQTQTKVAEGLFKRYMRMPYERYLTQNSSMLLRTISSDSLNAFSYVIVPVLLLITEFMVVLCIIVLLLCIDPQITLLAGVLLGVCSATFFLIFKRRIREYGSEMQSRLGHMIKAVNQGLGGFKEIKVNNKEDLFIEQYNVQIHNYTKSLRLYQTISQVPRLTIETVVIMSVLLIACIMANNSENSAHVTAVLAIYTMAAFRLMPSINRINGYYSTIIAYKPSLDVVYNDWTSYYSEYEPNSDNKELEDVPPINDLVEININGMYYKYPGAKKWTLEDITLSIPFGSTIGIVGPSGSGKTTFVDLLLGVLVPTEGYISVNGYNVNQYRRKWAKIVGYIPQSIYLTDDSIRANVAFGLPSNRIDDAQLWNALEKAQLKAFVESLEAGLDTVVGERGIRLSGGQRQRLGIARALYDKPQILVLDEATSALDTETESEVMKAIDELQGTVTMIIIAHRISTIRNCDRILEITNGIATILPKININ